MRDDRDPGPGAPEPLSYSYRETPADVWRNRVGVTGTLFAIAISVSYLLGRPRR